MKSGPKWLSLIFVALSITSSGCQSTEPQIRNQEFTDDEQEQYSEESEEEATTASLSQSVSAIIHPSEPTAWFTKKLVMTSNQPSSKDINDCTENLDGKARSATNLDAMRKASLSLNNIVVRNKVVYHWCFYQLMANLDSKMEEPLSLMDEKADIFLDQMAKLWILAYTLDDVSQTNHYMKYLRARYTNISQHTFGRNLELMNHEMLGFSNNGRGKPAGFFFDQQ